MDAPLMREIDDAPDGAFDGTAAPRKPEPAPCGVGETMTVLQEVVEVRADRAGRAPRGTAPAGP